MAPVERDIGAGARSVPDNVSRLQPMMNECENGRSPALAGPTGAYGGGFDASPVAGSGY